jgi:hypothetical protein
MTTPSRSDSSSRPRDNGSLGRRGFITALLVSTAPWFVDRSVALVRVNRDTSWLQTIAFHNPSSFKEEKCL